MDLATFWAVVAAVASCAGLFVMLRQLAVARNSSGGRGIEVAVHGEPGARGFYSMKVSLIGPGVRHSVEVSLLGAETPDRPSIRPSMDCNSEAIRWTICLPEADAENAFCLVTWIDAMGDGVRSGALCVPLIGHEVFEWKWFRSYSFRRWIQRQTKRPGPLGKWIQVPNGILLDGQGPRDHIPPLEPTRQRTTRWRWAPPQLPS